MGLIYQMTGDSGSFTLTGVAALRDRSMVAATTSFTLTGIDATLRAGKRLVVDAASFVLTGVAALLHGSKLTLVAGTGAFAVWGAIIRIPVNMRDFVRQTGTKPLPRVIDPVLRKTRTILSRLGRI